ncbi:MAG: hypothetical protein GVY04_06250 [Cyanobacteria bacterium]|jgi:hypothetical protein|nr:hypothetical protein [Cyanobacteria bacterium GSL.Bin1]
MTLSHLSRRLESNADLMINTLFTDIDQILQTNGSLDSVEETEKKDVAIQKSDFSKSQLSALPDAPELEEASDEPREPKNCPFWQRHLDKIIFFSSCSLLISSLLLLEKDHQFSLASFQEIKTAVASSDVQGTTPVDTNAQFIRYMERALVEIDREQELAETGEAKDLAQKTNQPVATVTPEINPTPAADTAPPQTIATLPALPPPPPPLQNATPPAPQPSPSPSSTPEPSPQNQTVPSTQSPAPQAEPAPSSETQPIAPETTAQRSAHTLVGLLELGDHSAALLKFEGATQRIMLEETIPGSNWKLVSVANQKATFTNQDQQKVMFVGEQMSVQ